MRQTLSRGVFAAAAATGILSLYGSPAFADTDTTAVTKDSGGVLSGNIVQVPIKVPVQVCGNSISVVEVLGRAYGNLCVNDSNDSNGSYGDDGYGKKEDTPPAPPKVRKTPPPAEKVTPPPTRISETHRPKTPPTRTSDEKPPATHPEKPVEKPAGAPPQLAETGSDTSSEALAAASAASAVLIAGGALMYRRGRAASYR
ncbi:hypothetical protein CLM62_14400 [Streptomyces sp. SA15]|uniref:chaplin n=1 Tax=Streptomyces sp. SA15 TaxID=934019 RepID=UPI000BAF4587|nr:chaplin [Streptomyces sp. SA15]PAZ15373.1 hypothetical protein CLM62_14400 [Streptomyces sp. SA15]